MDFTCIFFGFLFTFAGLWFAFGKATSIFPYGKYAAKREG